MARSSDPPPNLELLSGAALRERLRRLPAARRRELLRSVWRGDPVTRRADAPLAVSVARRQQRSAQYSWLSVPAVTLVLWAVADLPVVVAIVGTIVAGYVATLVLARAVRAERVNRGLTQDGGPSPSRNAAAERAAPDDGAPGHGRRHLPGGHP
jgi:hypothetical protein